MLKRFLRDVRQKPKGVRDNIALASAAIFTALVFSVWLYHFPSKVETLVAREEAAKDDPAFTSFFSGMKEQLANLQGAKEEAVVVTTEEEVGSSYQDPFASTVAATSSLDSFLFATSTPTSSSTTVVATTSQEAVPVLINAPREIRIITVSASTTATTSPERQ